MSKILIVDDEANMRRGLRDNLEFEGHEIEESENGAEALEKAQKKNYDLILLDIMMPKISGLDVLRKLRESSNKTPVILLTAKGEEIDKVLGLELGADDYITKPFSLRELLARVKAVLRRTETTSTSESEIIKIGKTEFNFHKMSAFQKGKPIDLTHKEFEIIKYLWNNKNNTVSRDDLLKEVWGYEASPTTRTIDNFIVKLRQLIETDSNNPKIILTVHGIGYKLIA